MALQDLDYRFGPRRPIKDNVMSHPNTYPQDVIRAAFEDYAAKAVGSDAQSLSPPYKAT